MNKPNQTAWLWWTALTIAGIAATFIVMLKEDEGNLYADNMIRGITMFSVIAIGICVISATAHWWNHR